jgi:hypothetical protein
MIAHNACKPFTFNYIVSVNNCRSLYRLQPLFCTLYYFMPQYDRLFSFDLSLTTSFVLSLKIENNLIYPDGFIIASIV